jgi:hypothetical protein
MRLLLLGLLALAACERPAQPPSLPSAAPPVRATPAAPADPPKHDEAAYLELTIDGAQLSTDVPVARCPSAGSELPRCAFVGHVAIDGRPMVVVGVVYEDGVDEEDRVKAGSPWRKPAPPGHFLGMLTVQPASGDAAQAERTFLTGYETRRGFWAIDIAQAHDGDLWTGTFEGEGTTLDGKESRVTAGRFRVSHAASPSP